MKRYLVAVLCSFFSFAFTFAEASPIHPFDIVYRHYDAHAMLYFTGHPIWQSIEVFLKEREEPYVIMTKHDMSQVDVFGNPEKAEQAQGVETGRESYFAPMTLTYAQHIKRPSVSLGYTTNRGEKIEFFLECADSPSEKYGGAVDPNGHTRQSSLPVMHRAESTLASKKSSVIIDGVSYEIPVKVSVPLFFTGMEGYYSRSFSLAVLKTGTDSATVIESPVHLNIGERWVFDRAGKRTAYAITQRSDTSIVIEGEGERITGEVSGSSIHISRIARRDGSSAEVCTLSFSPPLGMGGGPARFTIGFSSSPTIVSGSVTVEGSEGDRSFILAADTPQWAIERSIRYSLHTGKDSFQWKAAIAP